ncbi:hypothetical protein SPRG_19021 [Saprolegnia parasitica CBS 223.65]|uniref:Uncharacterized protein n=1 Tax=Saprolegnia parasitica (strain CBS 223.65) TaxID=695850 RepID=A0A067D699_SAPPC|nr:hypothetical protein SPRG_19021 [Saprolegnia parasitica CBS 223.65]KDO34171.1 hypothetical protein SPRG_19021 [Saprolegnia parasitica CBS 223.65]|eukprot:XP_012195220.1 hypothetical protein SPRG_19021 [Saprolegnia parasitica CBS 223.65]
MPSVSARLQRRVATLLVNAAPTLAQCQDEFKEVQDRPRGGTRCVKMLSRDVPTKRGLAVLATLAPSAIALFAPAWLSALPPTIEATRDLLFPIVGWAHRRLEQTHRDAVSCLAAECLGRLLAARVPVCANPALVMSDMELRKEHCAQCQQVAAFLQDNTKAHVVIQARSYDVCSIVRKLVTAHKDRLYFTTDAFVHGMYSPATVLRKVLPSAGSPRADAPNDDQVHDDSRIAALEAILADDTRRTKRPRLA